MRTSQEKKSHTLSLIACKIPYYFSVTDSVDLRDIKGRKIVSEQLDTSLVLKQ